MDDRRLHAQSQLNHCVFAANRREQSMESGEQQLSGGREGARGRTGSGTSTASSGLASSSSRRRSSSSSNRSRSSSSKRTESSGGGGGGGGNSGPDATPTVAKSLPSVSSSESSGAQTLPSPSGLRTPRAHGHFTRPRRFSPIKMEASPSASMMGARLGAEAGWGGRRRESSGVASGSLSRSPK